MEKSINKHIEQILYLAKSIHQYFPNTYLAGGTAIMLSHAHRISVDIDLFSEKPINSDLATEILKQNFNIEQRKVFPINTDFIIKSTKISFVYFPSINRFPLDNKHGLPIASDYDLFLNKIYAAKTRIEPKDLYDAAFLLRCYSWEKTAIKNDFKQKFPFEEFEFCVGALLDFDEYKKYGKIEKWVMSTLSVLY